MSPRLRWGAGLVLVGVVAGVALIARAMDLYPGGTAIDARAPGHSFWLNLLCDLTEAKARNGALNPLGSRFARAGMMVLSLSLGVHWLLLPAFMRSRALGWSVRALGAVQTLGLAAVPFAHGIAHPVAIFAAAGAGLVAGVLALVALAGSGGPARRWAIPVAVLAAVLADAVFYARSVATSPRVVTPSLPVFQRIGGLLAVAWMVAVAVEILAAGRARGAAPLRSTS